MIKVIIRKLFKLLMIVFIVIAIYIFGLFIAKNYIRDNYLLGSYHRIKPLYILSESVIKANRGNDKIYTWPIGGFRKRNDENSDIFYENTVAGFLDTYQALIYDNKNKTGIKDVCDQESGKLLYCGCVSEISRWCMVHIQF